MTLPDDFMFSQSSLQDYVDCPRRFELRYLLKQRWPAPEVKDVLEHEERMQRGQRFHQLVHQHQIGIPAKALQKRIHDPHVQNWFDQYLRQAVPNLPDTRYPERVITIPLMAGRFGLLAKIDLLTFGDAIQIIDWKTSDYAPKEATLQQRLQTVVYRYAVARGAAHLNGGQPIDPAQIEMVYWYVANGQVIHLPYDADQMQADEAMLLGLIDEIDRRANFPLTPDDRRCNFCTYRSLCDRGREAGSLADYEADEYDPEADFEGFEIDIDQIAEIEF